MKQWKGHEHEELMLWADKFCETMLKGKLYAYEQKNYTVLKYRIGLGPKDHIWADGTGFRGLKWLRESMLLDDRFKNLSLSAGATRDVSE
jgi:hypothetical protein